MDTTSSIGRDQISISTLELSSAAASPTYLLCRYLIIEPATTHTPPPPDRTKYLETALFLWIHSENVSCDATTPIWTKPPRASDCLDFFSSSCARSSLLLCYFAGLLSQAAGTLCGVVRLKIAPDKTGFATFYSTGFSCSSTGTLAAIFAIDAFLTYASSSPREVYSDRFGNSHAYLCCLSSTIKYLISPLSSSTCIRRRTERRWSGPIRLGLSRRKLPLHPFLDHGLPNHHRYPLPLHTLNTSLPPVPQDACPVPSEGVFVAG